MQRKAQKMPHKFFPQIGTSLLDDRKVYSAVQTACHISHNQKEDQKKNSLCSRVISKLIAPSTISETRKAKPIFKATETAARSI